jgi:SAM-dependent methyltransferase
MGNDIRFHDPMTSPPRDDDGAPAPHDSWAPHYERVMELTYGELYERLTSCALAEIRRRLPRGTSIVDFGAGCGRLALPLAAEGYAVTAVEPSRPMLEVLSARRAAMLSPSAWARLTTVQARMQKYRTERAHHMALCVFTVIAYLLDDTDLADAFDAAHGSLAPEGLFLVDVPDRALFTGFDHEDGRMIRTVEIDPVEGDRYAYEEHTTLRTSGGTVSYRDRFTLRRWSVEQVESALTGVGFEPVEDVSGSFAGLGAHYLLMRRSR